MPIAQSQITAGLLIDTDCVRCSCSNKRRISIKRLSPINVLLRWLQCTVWVKKNPCWRHVISNIFVDIKQAADLGWLASCHRQRSTTEQSHQRLSLKTLTYERVCFGRWWTFWAYYVNWNTKANTWIKWKVSSFWAPTSLLMETALMRLKDV